MSETAEAVRNALTLIGATTKTANVSQAVPTARTRESLDYLAGSQLSDMMNPALDVREIAEGLFKPKATKVLMKAFGEALQVPGKYSHAVELAAYVAALVPLMEPDRLARVFGAVNEVETAFAPARYTLQLSGKLANLLRDYPEERREKLAYSLWVEAHTDRWWDLTAGQAAVAAQDATNTPLIPENELIELFSKMSLTYSREVAAQIRVMPESEAVREMLAAYNDDLAKEKYVNPDIAVLASHVQWLKPFERPESPVGGLLDTLKFLHEELDHEFPKKPTTFASMFPDIKLYGDRLFPFPDAVMSKDRQNLVGSVSIEVVKDAIALAANRDYMGNCTWSYKNRMEQGSYVLFRLLDGEKVYNAAMVLGKKSWTTGEINSRFNRGEVPTEVRAAFSNMVNSLPDFVNDSQALKVREYNKKLQELKRHKFRYTL
jgi:hypothetical protein